MKLTNTPLALLASSFALLLLGAGPAPQELENDEWPKAIELPNARIVIYQPELESFEGNELSGRAAVSITAEQTGGEPVFGVVWIDARVETDRDARTVTVLDIEVPTVRFPDSDPENEAALAAILEEHVPE